MLTTRGNYSVPDGGLALRQLGLANPEAAYTGGRAARSARPARGCVHRKTRSAASSTPELRT